MVLIFFPRQRTLSHKIASGLVAPGVTPKIICAHAHLKYVTFSEHFPPLVILRAYNKYALERFGVIPLYWAIAFQQIKIGLKSRKRT